VRTSLFQLPTYAENMALPAFADARRAAAPRCCGAGRAAVDRHLLPAGPTAANPPHAAAAGGWNSQTDRQTNRRTDTVPFHRPCFAYYAGSDSKVGMSGLFPLVAVISVALMTLVSNCLRTTNTRNYSNRLIFCVKCGKSSRYTRWVTLSLAEAKVETSVCDFGIGES